MTTHRQRYKIEVRKLSATPVIMRGKSYMEKRRKNLSGCSDSEGDNDHGRQFRPLPVGNSDGLGGVELELSVFDTPFSKDRVKIQRCGEEGVREGRCLVWNCSASDSGEIRK
jgi:hypothetical protein